MRKSWVKSAIQYILPTLAVLVLSGFASVYAEDPDAFLVKVEPSSFGVNEAVDVTITAVKNGVTVKTYVGDVFIEVDGIANPDDYTVPADGLGSFLLQSQGIQTYSKGLIIKKSGTFILKVSDIINENIKGETTIIVGNAAASGDLKNITIISPVSDATETREVINVMGNSRDLPNSTVSAYINGIKAGSAITTSNGDFSLYLSGVQMGANTLKIKIENIEGVALGESQLINFNYQPTGDGTFQSIEINPNTSLKQGDKISMTVKTSDAVTSASINTSDGKSYPLDRISAGVFAKEIQLQSNGTIYVDVSLMAAGNKKDYAKVASLIIQENTTVTNIKFFPETVDGKSVTVKRDAIGAASKYRIKYGTSADALAQFTDVTTTEVLIENLQLGQTYFFEITSLDTDNIPIGTPSNVVDYKPGSEVKCIVKNITINQEQIGDKYYLTRSPVENVEKYVVYKSSFETSTASQMEKVAELTGTQFEYPYNKIATKKEYAYYMVEAVCTDGNAIKLDQVKKVEVGPKENLMLILLISIFGYVTYTLYRSGTAKQTKE